MNISAPFIQRPVATTLLTVAYGYNRYYSASFQYTTGFNAANGFGGCGQKMVAVLPLRLGIRAQPQPGLMHQGGGLQRLAGRFMRHLRGGKPAQFIINQRQKLAVIAHAPPIPKDGHRMKPEMRPRSGKEYCCMLDS